jgi:hypothetical protein
MDQAEWQGVNVGKFAALELLNPNPLGETCKATGKLLLLDNIL